LALWRYEKIGVNRVFGLSIFYPKRPCLVGGFFPRGQFVLGIYPGLKSAVYFLQSLEIRKTNVETFVPTSVFDSKFEIICFFPIFKINAAFPN